MHDPFERFIIGKELATAGNFRLHRLTMHMFSVKVKANPLEAWRGPDGSRRVRLPDLKTLST